MPVPNLTPVLTDYLSLGFNQGEVDAKKRKLTVSREGNQLWLPINWDTEYFDPKGQHTNGGGWSIMRGPCSYALRVHARCKELEPNCSTHIQGYTITKDANGVQTIVSIDEAPERPVLPLESSHTHIDGELVGVLLTGQYLQTRIDYWNAGRNQDGTFQPQASVFGWLVGASVRGFWGPLPDDMPDTV